MYYYDETYAEHERRHIKRLVSVTVLISGCLAALAVICFLFPVAWGTKAATVALILVGAAIVLYVIMLAMSIGDDIVDICMLGIIEPTVAVIFIFIPFTVEAPESGSGIIYTVLTFLVGYREIIFFIGLFFIVSNLVITPIIVAKQKNFSMFFQLFGGAAMVYGMVLALWVSPLFWIMVAAGTALSLACGLIHIGRDEICKETVIPTVLFHIGVLVIYLFIACMIENTMPGAINVFFSAFIN